MFHDFGSFIYQNIIIINFKNNNIEKIIKIQLTLGLL